MWDACSTLCDPFHDSFKSDPKAISGDPTIQKVRSSTHSRSHTALGPCYLFLHETWGCLPTLRW